MYLSAKHVMSNSFGLFLCNLWKKYCIILIQNCHVSKGESHLNPNVQFNLTVQLYNNTVYMDHKLICGKVLALITLSILSNCLFLSCFLISSYFIIFFEYYLHTNDVLWRSTKLYDENPLIEMFTNLISRHRNIW